MNRGFDHGCQKESEEESCEKEGQKEGQKEVVFRLFFFRDSTQERLRNRRERKAIAFKGSALNSLYRSISDCDGEPAERIARRVFHFQAGRAYRGGRFCIDKAASDNAGGLEFS
jgi:hypothetical protein